MGKAARVRRERASGDRPLPRHQAMPELCSGWLIEHEDGEEQCTNGADCRDPEALHAYGMSCGLVNDEHRPQLVHRCAGCEGSHQDQHIGGAA